LTGWHICVGNFTAVYEDALPVKDTLAVKVERSCPMAIDKSAKGTVPEQKTMPKVLLSGT
jgi:hypothetical protein